MEEAKVTATTKAAEVRLGLVLYGGVSLAIYMNGVVNELFRAVRGRGPFFLLKELLDADIIVDIVSGASAGGINGIFLGFALANEREFGTCAELWREHGALSTLLRKPNELNGDVRSVLDSEHYQKLLTLGFHEMWKQKQPNQRSTPTYLESPSPVVELDLFITGTNFYGSLTRETDTFGHALDVKSHQTLFWLKHRSGRKHQLSPLSDAHGTQLGASHTNGNEGFLAFGKLAHITSCFPGAFASVSVGDARETDEGMADAKLRTWGRLQPGTHYFVDGGVLDNKPFTSTLNAIFYRTSRQPVCRHLIYLEPDPRLDMDPATKAPDFIRTVINSVATIPSYESIAGDLDAIRARNQTLDRFSQLERLARLGTSGNQGSTPPSATDRFYTRARYLGLAQRVIDELPYDARTLRQELEAALAGEIPDDAGQLTAIDVEYPLRRLMDLTYALHDLEVANLPSATPISSERRRAWDYANAQIEVLEVIRSALLAALVPRHALRGLSYWKWALQKAQLVLDQEGLTQWLDSETTGHDLEPLRRELMRRSELHESGISDGVGGAQRMSVLTDLETKHEQFIARCGDPDALKAFRDFPVKDRIRYPLQLASGIYELDRIRVTRFSPADAKRGYCNKSLENKLSGETLGHFGAFLKRSWRSNDILWGRLDGICQLLETLLLDTRFATDEPKPESYIQKSEQPLQLFKLSKLRSVLGTDLEPIRQKLNALFPSLAKKEDGPTELLRLAKWIHNECELNTPETREEFLDLLTRIAQLDTLCEELPRVIADAAKDELEWNQYARHREEADGSLTTEFIPGKAPLDPALIGASVRQLAENFSNSKSAATLGKYFEHDYKVGCETLRDIPTTALAALGAQAAVVGERALTSGNSRGKKFITSTHLYRWIIRTPFQIISALASAINRSPSSQKPVFIASLLYLALSIVMNILYAPLLYHGAGAARGFAFVAFVGLPIGLIMLLFFWVRGWVGRLLTLAFLLIVASAAFEVKRENPASDASSSCS